MKIWSLVFSDIEPNWVEPTGRYCSIRVINSLHLERFHINKTSYSVILHVKYIYLDLSILDIYTEEQDKNNEEHSNFKVLLTKQIMFLKFSSLKKS